MKSSNLFCLSSCLALLAAPVAGFANEFWLEAGPVFRGGMKVSARGSSSVQVEGIRSAQPRSFRTAPPDIPSEYGNWDYDDGFVYIDVGTLGDSSTWYWRYTSDEQHDALERTLTFRRNAGTTHRVVRKTTLDTVVRLNERFDGAGIETTVGFPLRATENSSVDFCARLFWLPGARSSFRGATFRENVKSDSYLLQDYFVHDTLGNALPPAPHEGTYTGGAPLIRNIPDNTRQESRLMGSRSWTAENRLHVQTDLNLLSLGLGPRLSMLIGKSLRVLLDPKITLNYLNVETRRSEQFARIMDNGVETVLRRWSDQDSRERIFAGAGLNAGLDWETGSALFIGIRGAYDWIPEDVNLYVGPNRVGVNASGYSASAVVGYRFGKP